MYALQGVENIVQLKVRVGVRIGLRGCMRPRRRALVAELGNAACACWAPRPDASEDSAQSQAAPMLVAGRLEPCSRGEAGAAAEQSIANRVGTGLTPPRHLSQLS